MNLNSEILVKELLDVNLSELKLFCDRWIGQDYFSITELREVLSLSKSGQGNASFLAFNEHQSIVAARLSFVPGNWMKDFGNKLSPELWKVSKNNVAYFKSLFVSDEYQNQGIGKALSQKSMNILKSCGAEAIICHSWLESPKNSSMEYLTSLGFEKLCEYPAYWSSNSYECIRCRPRPCECHAVEMIKYLESL